MEGLNLVVMGLRRETGGLAGGLGDVELAVPAQACLTAITVSMS